MGRAHITTSGRIVFLLLSIVLLSTWRMSAQPRPSADGISPRTRELLDVALGKPGAAQVDALRALPERPDWQPVLDHVMALIAKDPGGEHNDPALVVEHIARRHLHALKIDIGPLLALLETRSWTNQQKAAQALGELSRRRGLFAQREKDAIRSLIRLTTSQRGRVVDAALMSLRNLTGEGIERDPAAWVKWFGERYEDSLDLSGSVYEILAVIRRRDDRAGGLQFSINDGPWSTSEALIEPYKELLAAAGNARVPLATVLVIPEIRFEEFFLREQIEPLRGLFKIVQPQELTFSPPADIFYPPFPPGLPAG